MILETTTTTSIVACCLLFVFGAGVVVRVVPAVSRGCVAVAVAGPHGAARSTRRMRLPRLLERMLVHLLDHVSRPTDK